MGYAQLVIGPAGSGKSTYCSSLYRHCETIRRTMHIVNLDPAAESFDYPVAMDIRELICLDDVMEELGLGPNGGLIYCMEYPLRVLVPSFVYVSLLSEEILCKIFWAETQQGIFDAVLKGVIDFDSDSWPRISDSAKDLITKMLSSCPSDRLTAHEVLYDGSESVSSYATGESDEEPDHHLLDTRKTWSTKQ